MDTGRYRSYTVESPRIEELRAEARYRRERADLYRARAQGSRPFDPARLQQLIREADAAAERLAGALARDRG